MKPVYLSFCGVNSFSERAEIDFASLLEFGIFGIFGDTGSGKSTILDCIGFALYGNVARSRSGSIADIINYASDRADVTFEFEIAYEGRRRVFRVERELKRKNAVQTVKVYERENGALHARSEGVRESNALLEKIVGLEQKDFEKCIALPQGEFAQFVRSQRSDRLKLVSRLFDLEEYGEKLVKKANARAMAAQTEYGLLAARLEPFLSASEEANAALAEEISRLEREDAEILRARERAREREKAVSALCALKEESDRSEARLAVLEARRTEIERLEGELGRLVRAEEVRREAVEAKAAEERLSAAERARGLAEERKNAAAKEAESLAEWREEETDAEIARLVAVRARAEQFEQANKKVAELERTLNETRAGYAAEAEKFKGFSYEREREAIGKRLAALGGEDPFSFAGQREKAAFFRAEYAEFTEELSSIQAKYPETAEDVAPLIEKYGALATGAAEDLGKLTSEFEAREKAREAEREKLVELEKTNGRYRIHGDRLQQLQTEGVRIKGELAEWKERAQGMESRSLAEIDFELASRRAEKKRLRERKDRIAEALAAAEAGFAAAVEKHKGALAAAESANARLRQALEAGGFASADEAAALRKEYGNAEDGKKAVLSFREEYAAVSLRVKELRSQDLSAGTREEAEAAKEALAAAERAREECVRALALKREELKRGEEALERRKEIEKEGERLKRRAETAERLKKLLEGNKFMEFVAEEYLVNVAQNASVRLLALTSGRYFLRYEGGFFVGDNFNGGKTRGVYTLSGGETFLVSLSLALALSAEICAKSNRPIEFFFLDEGFGTLDERLVDVVMDSLEKLKGEHFSIGIISHVEELKHRIEKKLLVEKATERYGSRIKAN